MRLRKYAILFFLAQCYHISKLIKVSDIYNFVRQLRDNSDSIHEYVSMVQAIFCPEQPICDDGDVVYSSDMLATPPASLTVDNDTLRFNDIKDFLGVCCLPCSCSATCQEDDICCPTKYYSSDPPNKEFAKRECIAATVDSYTRPAMISAKIPRYFMSTKCFKDTSNSSLVSDCETPDNHNPEETVPVTSVRTGRTYWNKQCAVCNNDAENLQQWSAMIILRSNAFIYFDVTRPVLFSKINSLRDLHVALARFADILYIPPVAMDSNRCFERHVCITCANQQELENKTELSFLQETCEQVYNPVYLSGAKDNVYLNIFCFLCLVHDEKLLKPLEKIMAKQMSAVLDYRSTAKPRSRLSDKHHRHHFEEEQTMCPCDKFYDHYKVSIL